MSIAKKPFHVGKAFLFSRPDWHSGPSTNFQLENLQTTPMTATLDIETIGRDEDLQRVARSIGQTPLFEIRRVFRKPGVRIFAKLEWHQLGESVKARPAWYIIKAALQSGALRGRRLLDATSGNTGIAYAAIGAALGVPVTLCLPENASEERKYILRALGAELVLTSRFEGTDGAQAQARALYEAYPDRFFYADQYNNEQNWLAHYETTAPEIWQQTHGTVTHFVAGLGTTGTLTGTGRGLRRFNPAVRIIGLQPDNPMHGLEGWKHLETAHVPGIYDYGLPDQILEIDSAEAYGLIREVARTEGLLLSPSAAANLLGAMRVAASIDHGTIVTTFADNASKYGEVLREILK
jgi:cysteine synthase B